MSKADFGRGRRWRSKACLSGILALSVALPTLSLVSSAAAESTVLADERQEDNKRLLEVEFKDVLVQNAIRVLSETMGVNIVATNAAGQKKFNLFVRDLTVVDAIDSMCRVAGLWYRYNRKTGVYIVMTTEEYQKDMVVFREEVTRMFKLEYLNVGIIARTIEDLFGDRVKIEVSADSDYGDDFQIGGLAQFGGQGEDDTDADRSVRGNVGLRSERRLEKQKPLTPEQLSVLEALGGEGVQRVSAGLVGMVAERKEALIYVTINRLHNLLFVRTSDEAAIDEIAQIVKQSDLPVSQVLLEMKVLEIELTDSFDSAFNFSYIGGDDRSGPDDGQPVNPLNPLAEEVGSKVLGLGNFGLLDSSTFVFQLMNDHIRARIELLERDGKINALATPMLLASNNSPARLFIGEQTVLTTGFENAQIDGGSDVTIISTPTPVTEVTDVGNTLTILPSINADNTVVMRIIHENSTVNIDGARIPVVTGGTVQEAAIDTIDRSKLEGTVMAKDGFTVAVGGMIRTARSDQESKVPLLGDIPLLGALFRETGKSQRRAELILLITPYIVSAGEESEVVSRQRLDALSRHPNEIDIYLNRLDQSRQESAIGRDQLTALARIAPARGAVPKGLEQSYLLLTQLAAQALHDPSRWAGDERLEKVRLQRKEPLALLDDSSIQAVPLKSWRDGALYVTAVQLTNQSGSRRQIDESRLRGNWLSTTVESSAIDAGQSTYAFLVSDSAFELASASVPKADLAVIPVRKPAVEKAVEINPVVGF